MQRRKVLGGVCIAAITLILQMSAVASAVRPSYLGRSLMQAAASPAAQKCVDEYTAIGLDGLKSKVPACAAGAASPDRATCCAQVRGVFNDGGPLALCLCEQQIYELVKGASATAGISGVSAANFDAYAKECQLQAVPNGNCPAPASG